MLKSRVLTALVLMPLVIWGVIALPTLVFLLAAAGFLAIGVWEWLGMVPVRRLPLRVLYMIAFAGIGGFAWQMLQAQPGLLSPLLQGAVIWWLIAFVWLFRPRLGANWIVPKALLGVVVLLPVWLALGTLHQRPDQGSELVMFVIALMWVADSGAYFAGKTFGRHKLIPNVSPGKTWEGVGGGMLASALFALLAGLWFGWEGNRLTGFVVLAVISVSVSIVGDLFISLLKRHQGLKDTGKLFPGHGGVLDRIDSLLAAGPTFVFGLNWLEL